MKKKASRHRTTKVVTTPPPKKPSDGRILRYYVVCLIDILGQSDRLQQWADLPVGASLPPEAIEGLKQTVGAVEHLRREFETFFTIMPRRTVPDIDWNKLSPEQQALYERAKACSLRTFTFSDTLVFYAPVVNEFGDLSAIAINRMLNACALMMFTCMAGHLVFRGGITLGVGIDLSETEIYGPALAQAHHIENKLAEYPRVIVSDEIVEFVNAQAGFSVEPFVERAAASINALSRSLVCRDSDGYHIVDFLGEGIRHMNLPPESDKARQELACRVHAYAKSECKRFASVDDKKLEKRFQRLLSYIETRLPSWGVQDGIHS